MDMQSQKYNPEVPTQQINNNDRFHQLNDKLITIKNVVDRQVKNIFDFEMLVQLHKRETYTKTAIW